MTTEALPDIDLPEEAVTEAPPAPAAPEEIQPGVLITINEQPDGKVAPTITPVGGTKITEVATVVQLALNTFKAENGLT